MPTATVETITEDLEREGHVVRVSGSRKVMSGKQLLVAAPKDGPAHQRMLKEFFEPLKFLEHLVSALPPLQLSMLTNLLFSTWCLHP